MVLAINIAEGRDLVEKYNLDRGLTFPTLLDASADVARLYRVRGIPASFFVGRDGVIRFHHQGALTLEQVEKNVETLLQE